MNPPQINLPLAKRNLKADVRLLWRYEMGPMDWEKLMQAAAECDVVVTAPGFVGRIATKNHLDNEHNAEFVRRLEQDGRFEGPVRMKIGKYDPVELVIFFRRSAPSGNGSGANS